MKMYTCTNNHEFGDLKPIKTPLVHFGFFSCRGGVVGREEGGDAYLRPLGLKE